MPGANQTTMSTDSSSDAAAPPAASAYLIGLIVEREFGSQASLIVFLALYFLFLWFSWLLAVWMTEPKRAVPAARG
jgi:hypothetical protein